MIVRLEAVSSANMGSRTWTFLVFLKGLNWQALNRFAPGLLCIYTPSMESVMASAKKEKSRTVWWQKHSHISLHSHLQLVRSFLLLSWLMSSFLYASHITWWSGQDTLVSVECFIALPWSQCQRMLWDQRISCRRAYSVLCNFCVFLGKRLCSWFLGLYGNHYVPHVGNSQLGFSAY